MSDLYSCAAPAFTRDDVLKMLYPDARAQSDLEDLYMEKHWHWRLP
jgi:hypothetical protein